MHPVPVANDHLPDGAKTTVDQIVYRARNRKVTKALLELPEPREVEPSPEALGRRGDPGPMLRSTPLSALLVREAIVRRNRAIDAAESAPAEIQAPLPKPDPWFRIQWVRATDRQQSLKVRAGRQLVIRGRSAGQQLLTLAVEGRVYRVPAPQGASPAASARRLIRSLPSKYLADIVDQTPTTVVLELRLALSHT